MPVSAREYLFSLEQIGIKLGLEQIRALVDALGRPDLAYPSLIVAGTNGKGSVTAMLERGLRAAGYRPGRYTSPHLIHLEERFVIDGEPIAPETLEAAAERVRGVAERLPAPPSFFEATTALALDVFRSARVDVAVLEVGLGGRLDATNVVSPVGVAITAIDFDHEQYLGHTIEAIAAEKAGVIKPGAAVVLGRNASAVQALVAATCARAGAPFVYAPEGAVTEATVVAGRTRASIVTPVGRYDDVPLALRGRHQVDNALTAVRLLETLAAQRAFSIEPDAIRTALAETVWPARLELLNWKGRDVLLDGAHNPAGARALAEYLAETFSGRLPIVVGVMRDKRVEAIVAALAGVASHFVFTAPSTPRAATPEELSAIGHRVAPGVDIHTAARPMDALDLARALGQPVVVAGSLYLCGEIRGQIS
jgi:dihydrofolate synthase/folylpolyglutamate synthase